MNSKAAKIILVAGVGLALSAFAAYFVLVKIPTDLASSVARGIRDTFNFTPEVRVNDYVVIEQIVPIAELATVSRDISVEYSWSHEWLGSAKTIALRGSFTAKAGFDLHEPFTIDIRKYPLNVRARMPAPKILSLQINSYEILRDEDGWWNKISNADRENASMALQQTAREKAQNSGMLAEARSTVEQRIKEIVERNGAVVEFTYPWDEK